MLNGLTSRRNASVNPSSANLLAEYMPMNGMEDIPDNELTLMMCPCFCCRIRGRTHFTILTTSLAPIVRREMPIDQAYGLSTASSFKTSARAPCQFVSVALIGVTG